MATQKWTFNDPTNGDTYSFSVNPSEEDPVYAKGLQFEALTAPGALPLLFEGQDTPTTFVVKGTILSEAQYTALLYWFQKRHPFQLTDDLGRVRWIYLTNFSPVRVRSALYPWKHTYSLTGYTLGETFPSSTVSDGSIPAA